MGFDMGAHIEPIDQKINCQPVKANMARQLAAIKGQKRLHGLEIIFGMGIGQPESRIDIALAVNMRHAISVTQNINAILGGCLPRRACIPRAAAHGLQALIEQHENN